MGLAFDYFYSLTPRQFDNLLAGHRRAEMNRFKAGWEQTRQMMWACLAPHQKRGANLTPEKLLRFPWEHSAEDMAVADLEAMKAQVEKQQEFWAKRDAKKIQA